MSKHTKGPWEIVKRMQREAALAQKAIDAARIFQNSCACIDDHKCSSCVLLAAIEVYDKERKR